MSRLTWAASMTLALCLHMTAHAAAQQQDAPLDLSSGGSGEAAQQQLASVSCASKPGERTQCPAVTAAGVALLESTGSAACLLGKTWGYDDKGVWVMDGCSGRFALGQIAGGVAVAAPAPVGPPSVSRRGASSIPETASWLDVAARGNSRSAPTRSCGTSTRLPADQTFTDHLGNERTIDGRNDIYPHRVMVFFKGWLGDPKLIYTIFVWTVNTTDQDAHLRQSSATSSPGGSASTPASTAPRARVRCRARIPYWLGHDRVMADEFFRPYFTYGVWAQGELMPGLWYNAWSATTRAPSASPPRSSTARSRPAPRSGGCPRRRSSAPAARTATGRCTRSVATRFGVSTHAQPRGTLHRRRHGRDRQHAPSSWPTA